ncbi:RNA polymerase sigma factor [Jiulongibacter sp. NS-SX5]|uniref:RNA polymerase sigma factor n=1 Tax=Jiulongibacter sp. NS-SX5 TaxID=3463854 RepID=UPI004058FD2C
MFRKKQRSFDLQSVLSGCLKNRPSAQKMLYEQYFGFAKSISMRYASGSDEVMEMVNDGFMKIFTKISMYDPNQSFEAWFKTVMVRSCIDYYRKNHAKVAFVDVDELHFLAYDDQLLEKISAEEILELVQHLPPAYRTVFSLYVVEGYSHAEIAKLLEINEGTSRSNLAKARMKMKEMVKTYVSDLKNYDNV